MPAVTLITLGALASMTIGSILLPDALARYLVPGIAAMVLAAGFALRPKEGLLAFGLLALFIDTVEIYVGPHVKQVDEAALLLIVPIGVLRGRRSLVVRLSLLREGGLALAIAAGVLGSILNRVPLEVWAPALFLLTKAIAVYYVALSLRFEAVDVRKYAQVLVSVAVVLLAIGAVEFVASGPLHEFLRLPDTAAPRGNTPSVQSLFFHPVLFGWFMAVVGLYAYAFFIVTRRVWTLALALGLTFGILLSGRRKPLFGVLAALVGGLGWSIAHRSALLTVARAYASIAVGIAALVLVLPPALGTGRPAPAFAPPSDRPSATEEVRPAANENAGGAGNDARTALYLASFAIARDHFPLGVGLGRYASWMSRVEYSPVYAEYGLSRIQGLRPRNPRYVTDTFWPMILGETGALGLLGYGVFVVAVVWPVWRRSLDEGDPFMRAFRLGTLFVFGEALVESLAAPSLSAPPVAYFAFAAAALATAAPMSDRRAAASEPIRASAAAILKQV